MLILQALWACWITLNNFYTNTYYNCILRMISRCFFCFSSNSQRKIQEITSPYNQVFFSINSILFDTCHWIELRLWSDLYLIQGRYIVIMGTPNKASSLSVLNGFDVYPSLYGSSPLMSNRIILLAVGPHFLRSACP